MGGGISVCGAHGAQVAYLQGGSVVDGGVGKVGGDRGGRYELLQLVMENR